MKKTKQIAVGFLMILSLCVSGVAACVCSHHTEKDSTETVSCHEHSEAKSQTVTSEKSAQLDSNEECGCLQPVPRVSSKSETIKKEKQATALPFSAIEIKAVSVIVFAGNAYFEKPFYLSDSFYNLKSPRAPPASA